MNDNNSIPSEDLIRLIAQLREVPPPPQSLSSAEFRQYLAGVAQGREQAAKRIEELLAEYGIVVTTREADS